MTTKRLCWCFILTDSVQKKTESCSVWLYWDSFLSLTDRLLKCGCRLVSNVLHALVQPSYTAVLVGLELLVAQQTTLVSTLLYSCCCAVSSQYIARWLLELFGRHSLASVVLLVTYSLIRWCQIKKWRTRAACHSTPSVLSCQNALWAQILSKAVVTCKGNGCKNYVLFYVCPWLNHVRTKGTRGLGLRSMQTHVDLDIWPFDLLTSNKTGNQDLSACHFVTGGWDR